MTAHARRRTQGAALLLVLWLIALLTALVGAFALTARTEHLQGQVLSRGVVAQEAARAGIEYAITRLALEDPRLRWRPDGRAYRWPWPEPGGGVAEVEIRIIDEQGKVDLNLADPALLEALLQALGSDRASAAQLAAAILDWRDPDSLTQPSGGAEDPDYAAAGRRYGAADAPLESVAELEQVLGMTPALYARLAPHLTVYSGRSRPDPAFASAAVLTALGFDAAQVLAQRQAWVPGSGQPAPLLPGGESLVGGESGTYSIDSRARFLGRTAVLRVVARRGGTGVPGSAWTPLRWEFGAAVQGQGAMPR